MTDLRVYNVVDIETTGFSDEAEIIEIASCLVTLDRERKTTVGAPVAQLFRPEGPIEPGARAVHHISPAMLADLHPITTEDRARFCAGACHPAGLPTVGVMVAHNIEYEQKFLSGPFMGMPLICTMKVALRLFPEAPSHSNGALYYWLMDQGRIPDLADAAQPMHRAGPDTLITAHLLAVMLQMATTASMIQWTTEPRLLPTCPIGDWKGKPWSDVEAGFLHWMVKKAGMEEDFKWNARRELDRRRGGQGSLA